MRAERACAPKAVSVFFDIYEIALLIYDLFDTYISFVSAHLPTDTTMSFMIRALVRALEPISAPAFSRSFSVYHAVHKERDWAKWRLENPEAHKRKNEQTLAYYSRLRSERPEEYRRRLDTVLTAWRRRREDPAQVAREQENHRLYYQASKGDERMKLYWYLRNWSTRYAWFREDLPWKSHRPVYHDERVEHHCEGCGWTKRSGNRLWWKKIQSSPTEADNWLCISCYVPRSDWKEAMPKGYEGLTTIKEIAKRRDELGHGT
jgi:hypothetical protein